MKQLSADPWGNVQDTYAVGQVRSGRVTRLTDFGAFVELEPGVEALAHASTFAPAGRPDEWTALVPQGMTGAFEILGIDLDKKRIGVALVPEGSARAEEASPSQDAIVPDGSAAQPERLGSLADKLRSALTPREK